MKVTPFHIPFTLVLAGPVGQLEGGKRNSKNALSSNDLMFPYIFDCSRIGWKVEV